MIAAFAHGLIGAILAVILGLFSALTPHPTITGTIQYVGPAPIVVTTPAHPIARRPVTITIGAMPLGVTDLRVGGIKANPVRTGQHLWRLRTIAPRIPGPWLLTLSFRLHGHTYTSPGSVLEVANHP